MKVKATFVKDGDWWVAWTDDVPGAMTQGKTLEEAKENLVDAIKEMMQPVDISKLPEREVVLEEIEV
ncbi:MAG: type II toxin-antitoxin system HicB family antitoxin [Thermodesulfovibrionales bacterium]|nr:type II toxin-antitoxin system HicB family antitoxin [Thermodesulfovibrionales bacterium]